MIVEFAKKLLVPSLWEIQVSFAAAAFIICVYCFFSCIAGVDFAVDDRKVIGDSEASGDAHDDKQKVYSLFFAVIYVYIAVYVFVFVTNLYIVLFCWLYEKYCCIDLVFFLKCETIK